MASAARGPSSLSSAASATIATTATIASMATYAAEGSGRPGGPPEGDDEFMRVTFNVAYHVLIRSNVTHRVVTKLSSSRDRAELGYSDGATR